MWIPRSTIEAVGLLEEAFFLNYEETDWCFRARRLGFPLFSVPTAQIWHKISASFKSRPHNTYFIFRNRRLWLDRQFPENERKRILRTSIVPEEARTRRKFLFRSIQKKLYRVIGRTFPPEKAEKLKNAAAALEGLADYKAGRFGNCPDWIINQTADR
jgi:GT2 family glycosyltransferase